MRMIGVAKLRNGLYTMVVVTVRTLYYTSKNAFVNALSCNGSCLWPNHKLSLVNFLLYVVVKIMSLASYVFWLIKNANHSHPTLLNLYHV